MTDQEESSYWRMSMFVVPTDTAGIEIIRNVGLYGHQEAEGTHAYVRYTDVQIPKDHLLGEPGDGFPFARVTSSRPRTC